LNNFKNYFSLLSTEAIQLISIKIIFADLVLLNNFLYLFYWESQPVSL